MFIAFTLIIQNKKKCHFYKEKKGNFKGKT